MRSDKSGKKLKWKNASAQNSTMYTQTVARTAEHSVQWRQYVWNNNLKY